MKKGGKIGFAVLVIVAVSVPTITYALGYWLSQAVFGFSLNLRVELTGYHHTAGEVMNVSFTLTNTGTRPILLTFPYSPTFDFSVKDFGGAIIYVWSWDKGYWPSVFECHLEPWQSMQATLSWTPDTPGVYTLTGYTEPFQLEGWEYGEWLRVRAKPIQFEVIG